MSPSLRTLLFSALVVTSCAPEETVCLTDTDCDQGQLCVNEVCTASCVSSTDCAEDEECIELEDGEGRACAVASVTEEDMNTMDEEDSWVLLVRDQSSSDCGTETSGVDLVGLRVRDATEVVISRGELILGDLGSGADASRATELDGLAFSGGCDEPAISLGCEGWVALRLVNEDGLTVPLTVFAESIETVERGASCGESDAEPYAVYACADSNAVANNDDISSCTRLLGEGSGNLEFAP